MFTFIDYCVLVCYFGVIACVGLWFGRKEKNTHDFFLGGKSMPWLAVCLSVLATETSAVTFIGAPAESYRGSFLYLQLAFGSLVGRILIAWLFLPRFYSGNVTTVYEYLYQRFGRRSQDAGVAFFFLTRLLASGVRLFVAALALHVVTGYSLFLTIVLVAGVALVYTVIGGIKAVIWTDVFQIIIFYGGALYALVYLLGRIPGGLSEVLSVAHMAGKLKTFNFTFDISQGYAFIAGIIGGCFLTFSALGTDQDMTQRMLTCKNVRDGQKAVIWTGILAFPIVILFLFIGVCIYVYYQAFPTADIPADANHIFPYFIINVLPRGFSALLIAGIFSAAMSSLDSALNALSSSAVIDIYKPYFKPDASEKHYLRAARIFVVVFAVLLVGIAYLCKNLGAILVMAFKITSYTYGGLLGVFLLGVLTKRGSNKGNIIAMISSVAFVYITTRFLPIGFTWYVVLGTLWTFLVGFLFRNRSD